MAKRTALEKIEVSDYGMCIREQIIAGVIKHYLILNPEGRKALCEILTPRMFKIDFGNMGEESVNRLQKTKGLKSQLLKADIDGKKLAELIDTAKAFSSTYMEEQGGRGAGLEAAFGGVVGLIDGKNTVENVTVEFLSFLTECCRAVMDDKEM